MKGLKVKFQNKKRKPNGKIGDKQVEQASHEHGHLGFLLRENTDTQEAKNQLRKASQQVYHSSPDYRNQPSWGDENADLPFYWLDEMTESQLKNIVNNKTGNSHLDFSPQTKHGVISCLSQGQIKARNQISFLRNYQKLQQDMFSKKSSFGYLRTEKSQQKNTRKNTDQSQAIGKNQPNNQFKGHPMQSKTSKKIELLSEQIKKKKDHSRNFSSVIKKSRMILVTPKIKQQNNEEGDYPLNRNKKINGLSTVYFKVPEFNSKHNLKRAVTVHCQGNSRQSLAVHKKTFYLKKTNTICVVQKQLEEANKCISLSNYKPMGYGNKGKMVSVSPEPGKRSSNQATNNVKEPQNAGENLKQNLNRLSMQKAAKTMMLRQEFERLRKLLKKQTIVQFEIDEDSPIRITKL